MSSVDFFSRVDFGQMRLISTAQAWFATLAVMVAAPPLCASIPRGYAEVGCRRSEVGERKAAVQAFSAPTNAVCADGAANAFTYDAKGLLLSATRTGRLPTATADCDSRLAFAYDAMNRLTSTVTRVSSFQSPMPATSVGS